MTLLAIDVGNSRVKWAIHDGTDWTHVGAFPTSQASQLVAPWANQTSLTKAVGCCVAGAQVRQDVEEAVRGLGLTIGWASSSSQQCGVRNRYDDAAQLGTDRWVGLVAARKRMLSMPGGPTACVVLSAGTAVTIDALTSTGEFIGGVIIPSVGVMADALEKNTAALKRRPGNFVLLPTNTADAIATGACVAVGGALARVERVLHERGEERCEVLITGGGAADLHPTLERDTTLIPNLVLEGLQVMADEME